MTSTFTYPGVYVTERPSGAQAVPAAATSIAMFVGMADFGPFNNPTRIQSLASYTRTFGETSAGEMADQVKQFFFNGGGDCYVMRIANGEQQAQVNLQNEVGGGTDVLHVSARDAGGAGNNIRIEVDYDTAAPELTFNLTAYRSVPNPDGTFGQTNSETFRNLSMNPDDARFVTNIVAGTSTLIRADDLGAGAPQPGGVSISGLILPDAAGQARSVLRTAMTATQNSFRVSVNGRPPVTAVINAGAPAGTNAEDLIRDAIENAYLAQGGLPGGTLFVDLNNVGPGTFGRILVIRSTEGSVVVSPAATNDVAVSLMLGSANSGLEFDAYSQRRPAPTGVFTRLGAAAGAPTEAWLTQLISLAVSDPATFTSVSLSDPGASATPYASNVTLTNTTARVAYGAMTAPQPAGARGSLQLVRDALDEIAAGITAAVNAGAEIWPGTARRQGLRLVLLPARERGWTPALNATLQTAAFDLGAAAVQNLGAYAVGTNPGGGRQSSDLVGLDGVMPTLADYQQAFNDIDSNVEIFNLMVLPRAVGQTDTDRKALWGAASSFCARQRAILFVDPPETWRTIDDADTGAAAIKIGVDTRNSIIYWPRVVVPSLTNPQGATVDPSGSMAGVFARTDTRFGTWKAPAGLEATVTSVLGLEVPMSDADNGRINPKAVNAIRQFPSGITSWGARTMVGSDDTGNVDDKYVNVRRTMLFIENSLYRGLRFAVFRSNAEPLWASIRLAADSFMNGLMLQGAFATTTKSTAYYVLCDGTTTTPDDINLGIVNVLVGFAPNKPAEFVHLIVTQLAGQVAA